MPIIDDILRKMEGAAVFTGVDLSQGYLQVPLAPESRYVTAFATPEEAPHQFKRSVMGACPSGDYFHEPHCANISDNIWLWSSNMTQHLRDLDRFTVELY